MALFSSSLARCLVEANISLSASMALLMRAVAEADMPEVIAELVAKDGLASGFFFL